MINLHDIESAITERLKGAGHTVTAAEVEEGFNKPTFFIDIFQNSVVPINQFMELVNVSVELRYFSEIETRETLVEMSDELRNILMSIPLKIIDRFLSISELTFDIDNAALLTYFELEFMRETATIEKVYEQIEKLEVQIGYGSSSGTD